MSTRTPGRVTRSVTPPTVRLLSISALRSLAKASFTAQLHVLHSLQRTSIAKVAGWLRIITQRADSANVSGSDLRQPPLCPGMQLSAKASRSFARQPTPPLSFRASARNLLPIRRRPIQERFLAYALEMTEGGDGCRVWQFDAFTPSADSHAQQKATPLAFARERRLLHRSRIRAIQSP